MSFSTDTQPVTFQLTRTQDVFFNEDDTVFSYVPPVIPRKTDPDGSNLTKSSGSNLPWEILKWILVAAALYGLWWLFRNGGRNSSTSHVASRTATSERTGPAAPIFAAASNSQQRNQQNSTVVSEQRTGYEGAVAMIEALKETGGKVTFGELNIDIPPQGVHVHVTDNNVSSGGSINVNITETLKVESGNDNRYFSRNGQKKEEPSAEKAES